MKASRDLLYSSFVTAIAGAVGSMMLCERKSIALGFGSVSQSGKRYWAGLVRSACYCGSVRPGPSFFLAFFVLLTIPSTAACVRLFGATAVLERAAILLTARHTRTVLVASFTVLLIYYASAIPKPSRDHAHSHTSHFRDALGDVGSYRKSSCISGPMLGHIYTLHSRLGKGSDGRPLDGTSPVSGK